MGGFCCFPLLSEAGIFCNSRPIFLDSFSSLVARGSNRTWNGNPAFEDLPLVLIAVTWLERLCLEGQSISADRSMLRVGCRARSRIATKILNIRCLSRGRFIRDTWTL